MTWEATILANIMAIFGGNILFLGLFFLAFMICVMLILRLPIIIMLPLGLFTMLILGQGATQELGLGGFSVIVALIAGVVISYFIYSLWAGR